MNCACGSGKDFEGCCGPYLSGESLAPTAEALMRSRYTAYTRGDIAYIKKTLAPEGLKDFDSALAKKWATQSVWKGLEIISTDKGTSADRKGVVEFMASYIQDGKAYDHHEVSRFRKNDKGEWLFVDGDSHVHKEGEDHHHHHHTVQQTVIRESAKVGRNDPCPCGSGKKYKKCCGVNA